jgi:hypothetical protein
MCHLGYKLVIRKIKLYAIQEIVKLETKVSSFEKINPKGNRKIIIETKGSQKKNVRKHSKHVLSFSIAAGKGKG